MSTFFDLIADVKQAVDETTGDKDQFLFSAAVRLYRQLLRADDWPQTRQTTGAISVVSGTSIYDLPADFDRFASNTLNYGWGTTGWTRLLPVLPRGTQQGDNLIAGWEGVTPTTLYSPYVAGIQSGGANGYQLVLYPGTGTTGDTITFDYYAIPARTEITLGTEIEVDTLYETLFSALCAEYWKYENAQDKMTIALQDARAARRNARMTLSRL